MKTATTRLFSFSIFAILLSGCYTQLEVVDRSAPHHDRFERPAPNRSSLDQQQTPYAQEYAYYDEESYLAGYEDGMMEMELQFRDFNRQPVFANSNQYALGYRDGFRDASWSLNRHRFHSRYSSWHWDPFWHTGWHSGWHSGWHAGWHSSFHVSWGWHRPHSFWYGHPHHFYGYYAHPVHFHGFHPHYGWGVHRTTWIVYNNNVINNTTVNRGPRASGVQRDQHTSARGVTGTTTRTEARPNTSATRSSGVSRDNNTVQRGTAGTTAGRDRGTVTRNPSAEGRSSGTTRSGVRQGGNSGSSTGTVQRGTTTGRSSGTVRSGGNRSGSSSSGTTNRRPRGNDLQSSNQLPVVNPGSVNSRERLVQDRPVVQQPPQATTRQRIQAERTSVPAAQTPRTTVRTQDDTNRPTGVTRPAVTAPSPSANTVRRAETSAPAPSNVTPRQRTVHSQAAPRNNTVAPQRQAAPPQRQMPAAQPAPSRQQAPAARQAPAPQQRQPAAAPQQNSSGNEARSTNRTRNRD